MKGAAGGVVRVVTDPAHGGRWTSLVTGGPGGPREWLWHRDEPRRSAVAPGDPFADAGGLEECLPTVRGTPDHGEVWSRPWTREGDVERVTGPDFRLDRRIRTVPGGAVVADYRLTAAPGHRFLWAAHALLDVSPAARLDLPAGAPGRRYPDGGASWTPFAWPGPDRFDRLGPDDGTALGAIVTAADVTVHDGPHALRLALDAPGQPVSVALWRNLRGFPAGAPYRSIGVEPMLGRVWDLSAAAGDEAALVPATGEAHWRLTICAG
ncbi:hypothetical protein [Actinacidiphila acididurans]|uniref:hypothetical protein n=1 Tax=Actinacidiphila acididurans TaxID=2784346 RepID=UPI0027DD915F|nr:hypothetical protein [Actinacidiphila acididurans]